MAGKSTYAINDSDLRGKLRSFMTTHGMDQKRLAASMAVSQSYISDVLLGRRDITDKIAAKLGYRKAWVRT